MSSQDPLPSLSSTSPIATTITSTSPVDKASSRRRHLLPHPHLNLLSDPSTPETREEAARAAKAELRAHIREDWSWSSSDPALNFPNRLDSESLVWRERDADSSSPSGPPSPDPYKFDSPDAVSQTITTRKRKRRRRLHDEMQWNEGVRNYTQRRNAWTGGNTQSTINDGKNQNDAQPSCFSTSPLVRADSTTVFSEADNRIEESDDFVELVPIPPPLLPPSNPIRRAITPATYPSIYSKVVIQGLSPTVPVNLADVTRALVAGWKENGEWPPRGAGGGVGVEVENNRTMEQVNGNGSLSGVGKARRSVWKMRRVLAKGKGDTRAEGETEEKGKGLVDVG
ncbi:hypothetical protein MMC20_004068 [Loxospora ochrophaea]|nr:hypothetical protein [Loxospora ochrophaea]